MSQEVNLYPCICMIACRNNTYVLVLMYIVLFACLKTFMYTSQPVLMSTQLVSIAHSHSTHMWCTQTPSPNCVCYIDNCTSFCDCNLTFKMHYNCPTMNTRYWVYCKLVENKDKDIRWALHRQISFCVMI